MKKAPVFRNTDKLQLLPHREWLRNNLPGGSEGFVAEDLDLVIRWYGKNYALDAQGAFMLIELKFGHSTLGVAQRKTFGMLDQLLRQADPAHERYLGYFLVQYSDDDWDRASFKINYQPVSREQFTSFWNMTYRPDPLILDQHAW